jgi:hypothetical protein
MMGNAGGASFQLRVVHSAGGGQYIGAGASSPEIPAGAGPSQFSTSLPISAGDMIGINVPSGVTWNGHSAPVIGAGFVSVQPTLTDSSPPQTPNFTVTDAEEGVNADVEPDCDKDGLGDESQDTNLPAACQPPAAQPVKKKKCKKNHKHRAAVAKKHCKKKHK